MGRTNTCRIPRSLACTSNLWHSALLWRVCTGNTHCGSEPQTSLKCNCMRALVPVSSLQVRLPVAAGAQAVPLPPPLPGTHAHTTAPRAFMVVMSSYSLEYLPLRYCSGHLVRIMEWEDYEEWVVCVSDLYGLCAPAAVLELHAVIVARHRHRGRHLTQRTLHITHATFPLLIQDPPGIVVWVGRYVPGGLYS